MNFNVYPDFDVEAELLRAASSVSYHEAQAAYFRAQIRVLRRAKDEQDELQKRYEQESDDVPLINDEMIAGALAPGLLGPSGVMSIVLDEDEEQVIGEDDPQPGV